MGTTAGEGVPAVVGEGRAGVLVRRRSPAPPRRHDGRVIGRLGLSILDSGGFVGDVGLDHDALATKSAPSSEPDQTTISEPASMSATSISVGASRVAAQAASAGDFLLAEAMA